MIPICVRVGVRKPRPVFAERARPTWLLCLQKPYESQPRAAHVASRKLNKGHDITVHRGMELRRRRPGLVMDGLLTRSQLRRPTRCANCSRDKVRAAVCGGDSPVVPWGP
jgi:hypothetical protein